MRSKKFCNLKFYGIATALCAVLAGPIANAEDSTLGGPLSLSDFGSFFVNESSSFRIIPILRRPPVNT